MRSLVFVLCAVLLAATLAIPAFNAITNVAISLGKVTP